MIIKTWRDPYESGFSPTRPKEIELKPGLTVLVGCNGAGKSTLINNIQDHCKKHQIPIIKYDNLSNGGSNSISEMLYNENYEEACWLISSSEGEAIKNNVSRLSSNFKYFFEKGYINDKKNRLSRIFADSDKFKKQDEILLNSNERVLLFDAVDSGLSVDSVIEIKVMFEAMIEDIKAYDKDIYIIITANEYELARNVNCFDVNNGNYLTFTDYEDYRKFIIKSRQLKEKRIEKQLIWREKQHQKELDAYKKIKEKTDKIVNAIIEENGGKRPTYAENGYTTMHKLEDAEQKIKDFIRNSRYLTKEEVEGTYG